MRRRGSVVNRESDPELIETVASWHACTRKYGDLNRVLLLDTLLNVSSAQSQGSGKWWKHNCSVHMVAQSIDPFVGSVNTVSRGLTKYSCYKGAPEKSWIPSTLTRCDIGSEWPESTPCA